MNPFDFRQVPDRTLLPLSPGGFDFAVIGESTAHVNARGINCRFKAFLHLYAAVNAIKLEVSNDVGMATITVWLATPNGLQVGPTKNVPSTLPVHLIRFDEAGIIRVTFESQGGELYLQTVS